MEDTLRDVDEMIHLIENYSLNPCCNGRYSQSYFNSFHHQEVKCLNPCFNGRYSQRYGLSKGRRTYCVLILVLMEDTLRDIINNLTITVMEVLILVLMEDTL